MQKKGKGISSIDIWFVEDKPLLSSRFASPNLGDKFGLELELDLMENFWTTDIELKLGEPVDCST